MFSGLLILLFICLSSMPTMAMVYPPNVIEIFEHSGESEYKKYSILKNADVAPLTGDAIKRFCATFYQKSDIPSFLGAIAKMPWPVPSSIVEWLKSELRTPSLPDPDRVNARLFAMALVEVSKPAEAFLTLTEAFGRYSTDHMLAYSISEGRHIALFESMVSGKLRGSPLDVNVAKHLFQVMAEWARIDSRFALIFKLHFEEVLSENRFSQGDMLQILEYLVSGDRDDLLPIVLKMMPLSKDGDLSGRYLRFLSSFLKPSNALELLPHLNRLIALDISDVKPQAAYAAAHAMFYFLLENYPKGPPSQSEVETENKSLDRSAAPYRDLYSKRVSLSALIKKTFHEVDYFFSDPRVPGQNEDYRLMVSVEQRHAFPLRRTILERMVRTTSYELRKHALTLLASPPCADILGGRR